MTNYDDDADAEQVPKEESKPAQKLMMMRKTNDDADNKLIICQVPEEESKPANQHRSSVDMTSHPQVRAVMRVMVMIRRMRAVTIRISLLRLS